MQEKVFEVVLNSCICRLVSEKAEDFAGRPAHSSAGSVFAYKHQCLKN
jgi:hypothetical protein